jgi:hypothetical protein
MRTARKQKARKRTARKQKARKQKARKQKALMQTMPVLSMGTVKTSGTYSSTLGEIKKMDWDSTINSSRDGASITFDVNKNNTKLSGDLNAVVNNNQLTSLKGTIAKNGKVHQVDMKDLNLLDPFSMQRAGLEIGMMIR